MVDLFLVVVEIRVGLFKTFFQLDRGSVVFLFFCHALSGPDVCSEVLLKEMFHSSPNRMHVLGNWRRAAFCYEGETRRKENSRKAAVKK